MFRGVAETRQIELRSNLQSNVTTPGVRRHMSQVINNLLDNALKYTPEGGQVEIELQVDQTRHSILTVADSGIGIAPNEVPKVFDRFFRSDQARSRESTRGAGLGLSISKSIIEAHGGEIVCQSEIGKGTRFVVCLPPCPHQ